MKKKYLVVGVSSGLGKYLYENLKDADGVTRYNFNDFKQNSYETIIHCAFNKELIVSDYKKYLHDNIFLIENVKKINYDKFVYISTIDIYNQNLNLYSLFKNFAESMLNKKDLILRMSCLLGVNSKINHLHKILNNENNITLSLNSTFNYVLYSEILNYFNSGYHFEDYGTFDFVANNCISIAEVINLFKSKTKTGDFTYSSDYIYQNPIYNIHNEFNLSSEEKLKKFQKELNN